MFRCLQCVLQRRGQEVLWRFDAVASRQQLRRVDRIHERLFDESDDRLAGVPLGCQLYVEHLEPLEQLRWQPAFLEEEPLHRGRRLVLHRSVEQRRRRDRRTFVGRVHALGLEHRGDAVSVAEEAPTEVLVVRECGQVGRAAHQKLCRVQRAGADENMRCPQHAWLERHMIEIGDPVPFTFVITVGEPLRQETLHFGQRSHGGAEALRFGEVVQIERVLCLITTPKHAFATADALALGSRVPVDSTEYRFGLAFGMGHRDGGVAFEVHCEVGMEVLSFAAEVSRDRLHALRLGRHRRVRIDRADVQHVGGEVVVRL